MAGLGVLAMEAALEVTQGQPLGQPWGLRLLAAALLPAKLGHTGPREVRLSLDITRTSHIMTSAPAPQAQCLSLEVLRSMTGSESGCWMWRDTQLTGTRGHNTASLI